MYSSVQYAKSSSAQVIYNRTKVSVFNHYTLSAKVCQWVNKLVPVSY